MSLLGLHRTFARPLPSVFRELGLPPYRRLVYQLDTHVLTRGKHSTPQPRQPSRKATPPRPVRGHDAALPRVTGAIPQVNKLNNPGQQRRNNDPKVYFPTEPPPKEEAEEEEELPRVRVRFLRPIVWSIGASSCIYLLLSYLQAKSELKAVTRQPYIPQIPQRFDRSPPGPIELATRIWSQQQPVDKVAVGLIGANAVAHLGSFLAPRFWLLLWHTPAMNLNFTLFTSTFVHEGPMHLLFNMWACFNFLPSTGKSPLFEGNAHHTLAFFLTTGILSGLTEHLTLLFKKSPRLPFVRSGGASGALFALLGVFCTQYPDAKLKVILLPFQFDAMNFLYGIMLFDFYGMIRGFKFINLGHAAHLSGAFIGIGYSWLDGKNAIWNPLVRFWKRRLQSA